MVKVRRNVEQNADAAWWEPEALPGVPDHVTIDLSQTFFECLSLVLPFRKPACARLVEVAAESHELKGLFSPLC